MAGPQKFNLNQLPTAIPLSQLAVGSTILLSGGTVAMTAPFNAGGFTLQNVGAGVNSTDGVNLGQVQSLMTALSDRAEVQYASTVALPANTYANGTAGVGATLTATANAALVIDGQTPAVGVRVLVGGEGTPANNGIYTVTQVGTGSLPYILTRATDMNTAVMFGTGIIIPVKVATGSTAGTANDGKVFMSAAAASFTVGTTSISFTSFGSAYTASTGLSLVSNAFSVQYGTTAGTAAQGNDTRITGAVQSSSLGTGVATALSVATGTAGSFIVNGGALGTPTTGTLTNCTGYPASALTGTLATTALNIASNEVPTGTLNGSNTAFVMAHTPLNNSLEVFYNGSLQPTGNYSFVGTALTMGFAPSASDSLMVGYFF